VATQPDAAEGQNCAKVVKQRTDLFTCVRDFIQYSRLKNIFWTTVTENNRNNSGC